MATPDYKLIRGWAMDAAVRVSDVERLDPDLKSREHYMRWTIHDDCSPLTTRLHYAAEQALRVRFNKRMWNVYKDGRTGLHHDSHIDDVAIISFGDSATFTLESCEDRSRTSLILCHGDLLYMPKHTNRWFAHQIERANHRASLVLRQQSDSTRWIDYRKCGHGS